MDDDQTCADKMPARALANPARLRASTAYPGGQIVRTAHRAGELPPEVEPGPRGVVPC